MRDTKIITMNTYQVPAILSGFSTTKDGGASVRFATNELNDTDFLIMKQSQGKYGWLMFREAPFQESDLPKEMPEDNTKTPSKRLRAVLFLLWKQQGENGDFENYYRVQMEKFIERIKNELD